MRPWSSIALLAVVLIKWISSAHGKHLCFQPENFQICQILMDHRFAINKRFLRYGRNFGEPFLRFGRSGSDDEDFKKRISSLQDKAFLRFGRSGLDDDDLMGIFIRGPSNYKGWQYRRKRATAEVADDDSNIRHRRAAEIASAAQTDRDSIGYTAAKRQTYFPRFGRTAAEEVMQEEKEDFEKRPERLSRSGWLHFGKRIIPL